MRSGLSLRRALPCLQVALPAWLVAGCALDGGAPGAEATATADQAVVTPSTPVGGASYLGTIPKLPGLDAGAYPIEGAPLDTSNTAIHSGVHFNGKDLAAGPVAADQSWLDSARGDAYSSTEPFPKRLQEALQYGVSMESKMDASTIDRAFSKLQGIGGTLVPGLVTTDQKGYPADRARWKKEAVVNIGTSHAQFPKRVSYADPKHFDEIRMRGARQYCAAREAARQQNGELISMGEQAAGSFRVFGKKIEVLVLEPTAVLSPPQRYTADGVNDGAQAFAVPMLFGNKVTPVRGLGLPGLGEVRSPLTLVSGDSEVVASQRGLYGPVLGSRYQTVSHADAFVTSRKGFEASLPEITLFRLGVFSVYLRIGFGVEIGALEGRHDSLLAGAPATWPGARDGNPFAAAFFQSYKGRTYYDGAWTSTGFAPTSTGLVFNAGSSVARDLPAYDPFVTSALQDDDHALRKLTTASLSASVGASLGFQIPKDENAKWGVGAKISVDGGLEGKAGVVHTLRDGAYGERVPAPVFSHQGATMMLPETGVLVTPSTMAQLDFVSRAVLKLYIKVPLIGKIGWSKTLYDISEPIARWESEPWDEQHRLRIGTGADAGNVMMQPSVASHLPQQSHFASFPQGVEACLAGDPGEIPDEPEPCEPSGDDGTAPEANMCLIARPAPNGAPAFPMNVCTNPGTYLQSVAGMMTPNQLSCVKAQLAYVCDPVSKVQWENGQVVIAHIVALEDPAVMEPLTDIMSQCGLAFGGTPAAVASMFDFGACDGAADLWGDRAVVPDERWHTPEDPGPGTCP